ncbi:hypothetical protein JZO72_00785 [Vagococcus fluvialis]|uniref:hypothetical protein n=1 Tax=Vagococcus fluvialis TaxID=2738 RepID=UPI001A9089E0|nr:hypothetical protein [Vagococcus fluvialis]MBO0478149.1 hypothetical protein [Vagococcus fluvialis]MBO0483640.1 hypothetical protein [Vagococcus fluvialis]
MNYREKTLKIEKGLYTDDIDGIKNQLYGYFSTLILSKKFAYMNNELEDIMDYFGLEFLPYVYKSRTILLSRIIRIIEKKDEQSLNMLLEELENYIEKFELEHQEDELPIKNISKKKKKKKNIFDDIFNQLG